MTFKFVICGVALILLRAQLGHSAEMPPSNLHVEIRGIIKSSDPTASVALLQHMDNGHLIAVKLGFQVFGQAKIIKIGSKTIILERDSHLEYLGAKPPVDSEPAALQTR